MLGQKARKWICAAAAACCCCGTAQSQEPDDVLIEAPEAQRNVRVIYAGGDESVDGDNTFTLYSAPTQKGTILGVGAGEVPEAVSSQLELPRGHGILINFVKPESPAAKAGLQVNDVLFMLEDQYIVNQDQLATLVQARKPGDEVKLTVFNKGKKQTVKAKLEEGEIQPRASLAPDGMFFGGPGAIALPGGADHGRIALRVGGAHGPGQPAQPMIMRSMHGDPMEMHSRAIRLHGDEEMARHIKMMIEKLHGRDDIPSAELHEHLKKLQELHLQGPIRIQMSPEGQLQSFTASTIKIVGEDNTFVQTTEEGSTNLAIYDKEGKELFKGPINTPEERAKVPANLMEKFDKFLKGAKGRGAITPPAPPGAPRPPAEPRNPQS